MIEVIKKVGGVSIVNGYANLNSDGGFDFISTSIDEIRDKYPEDFIIEGVTILNSEELILFETVEDAETYLLN